MPPQGIEEIYKDDKATHAVQTSLCWCSHRRLARATCVDVGKRSWPLLTHTSLQSTLETDFSSVVVPRKLIFGIQILYPNQWFMPSIFSLFQSAFSRGCQDQPYSFEYFAISIFTRLTNCVCHPWWHSHKMRFVWNIFSIGNKICLVTTYHIFAVAYRCFGAT